MDTHYNYSDIIASLPNDVFKKNLFISLFFSRYNNALYNTYSNL
jgi:hypothetical protein